MLVDFKNPCGSHKVIKMKVLEGEGARHWSKEEEVSRGCETVRICDVVAGLGQGEKYRRYEQ